MVREYNKLLSSEDIHNQNIQSMYRVPKKKDLPLLESHQKLQDLAWVPDGDDIGFGVTIAFKI
jgi:hypothetical protein